MRVDGALAPRRSAAGRELGDKELRSCLRRCRDGRRQAGTVRA